MRSHRCVPPIVARSRPCMVARCVPPIAARCRPCIAARCGPPVVARCRPLIVQSKRMWHHLSREATRTCYLENHTMERIHMNHLRELIYRLRAGESQRRIAQDLSMSRTTVSKYRTWAKAQGYLDATQPLPDDATLAAAFGEPPRPPCAASRCAPGRTACLRGRRWRW